ncbi:MAG: excinuclease ABC subunit A, partial [Planctomycetaceae bacterium]
MSPVLASGTHARREVFDAAAVARRRDGDLDLRHVGRDAKMPWQTDGPRWHTVDRIAHNGRPCRWDGSALQLVIDQLEQTDGFAPANWNQRTIVEMMGASKTGGWFLHAMTGDEWLLTLKFRVPKNTFDQDRLRRQIDLKSIDEIDELPIYGRSARVRVRNLKGPWQEITVHVHWLHDIETAGFRTFLEDAKRAYLGQVNRARLNPDDLMPWKVLGRKWHLLRKGFPSGKRVGWDVETLEKLFDLLLEVAPAGDVDWANKQVVYFRSCDKSDIWAAVHTKRRGGIDLSLYSKPGRYALGRIAEFGREREISPDRSGREEIKIRFTEARQVRADALKAFLREHAADGIRT